MSLEEEKDLKIGQLIITENNTFGLEEKWFSDSGMLNRTITYEDNIFIPKHTVGIITGFMNNWAAPVISVCWGGDFKGRKLVITLNKATLLDKFIEKLDNEETNK